MGHSNESDQGIPVTPDNGPMALTMLWLNLYAAAMTGLIVQDVERQLKPASYALDAADIADAGARLVARRQELVRRARAVVDQPEPDPDE